MNAVALKTQIVSCNSKLRFALIHVAPKTLMTETCDFYEVIPRLLLKRGMTIEDICPPHNAVARRALEEYGAVFVADESVALPRACVFSNEPSVEDFQRQAGIARSEIGETIVELQFAALEKLLLACDEATGENLNITPRGGAEASRRTYADTLRLWSSRVAPALEYWCKCGGLTADEAASLDALPIAEQVSVVLDYEARGLFFSKDFSKSITRSVALPGASQHLSMLAFDVVEFQNPAVREILARHGWFQTVASDLPHFTFLGRAERDLPALGLRCVEIGNQTFWIPNVP